MHEEADMLIIHLTTEKGLKISGFEHSEWPIEMAKVQLRPYRLLKLP